MSCLGRRRTTLHRLLLFLGTVDPRAQPSGRAHGDRGRGGPGDILRRADAQGERAGEAHLRKQPVHRDDPVRELRHGSGDVGHPARARRDGSSADHQVRRLLPRTRGRPAGAGGQRAVDLRHLLLRRRARRGGERYDRGAAERPARPRGGDLRLRARHRGGDHRAHPGEQRFVVANERVPGVPARDHAAPRHPADLRRSDLRFPRGLRRRRGALRHQARHHHLRQDHRRRHAGGRVRREPRGHASHRAGRQGVPGRHAERQPGGDGRRQGAVERVSEAGILRRPGAAYGSVHGAAQPFRGCAADSVQGVPLRVDLLVRLFRVGGDPPFRRNRSGEHEPFPRAARGAVGTGRVPRAFGIRSGIRLVRAHRRGVGRSRGTHRSRAQRDLPALSGRGFLSSKSPRRNSCRASSGVRRVRAR